MYFLIRICLTNGISNLVAMKTSSHVTKQLYQIVAGEIERKFTKFDGVCIFYIDNGMNIQSAEVLNKY